MAVIEVITTGAFEEWFSALADEAAASVIRVVDLLEHRGVALGFPYTSDIKGTSKIRELRVKSKGKQLRVFYAFDPLRQAVLLLGGDKTGDDRFYATFVPRAEVLLAEYLESLVDGEEDGP